MANTGVKSPNANSGSGWTSRNLAYADGGGSAVATSAVTTSWWGYAFGIPDGATIDGIIVYLDAYVTGLVDAVWLNAELSWDSGASWTATQTTTALTESETVYTLGSAVDTWGRSWTTAQMASGVFRVRLTPSYEAEAPLTTEVDWLRVDVFYTEGPITKSFSDSMTFSESVGQSIGMAVADTQTFAEVVAQSIGMAVADAQALDDAVDLGWDLSLFDRSIITDAGGAFGAGGGGPGGQYSGSVVDEMAGGGPTFEAAADQFLRSEAAAVQLILLGATPRVFQVGEAVGADAVSGPGAYQPGVLEWGDMVFEGVTGIEYETASAVVRFRNTTMADLVTQLPVDLATSFQASYVIGGLIRINAFVLDAGLWYTKILFLGRIEEAVCTAEHVEIRAVQVGDEEALVPTKMINESSFIWGAQEGTRPRDFFGSVVPIFYGRFHPTAIKEYAAGTQLEWDHFTDYHDGGAQPASAYKRFMAAITYCLGHGVKFPMLQLPLAANGNRGYNGDAAPLLDKMRQAIFVYGDLSTSPIFALNEGASPQYNFQDEVTDPVAAPAEYIQHLSACTWRGDSDSGLILCRDLSNDLPAYKTSGGAGDARAIRTSGLTRTGGLAQVCGFYINTSSPSFETEQELWSGVVQSIVLPCTEFSKIRRTTGGIPYLTDGAFTGDAENVFDADPETYATIVSSGGLSLQLPAAGPDLGEVLQIRIGVLTHRGGPSATALLDARYSYAQVATLTSTFGTSQSGAGVTFDPQATGIKYAIIKKRTVTGLQDYNSGSESEGFIGPWDFGHVSQRIGAGTYIVYPGDVLIRASGGDVRICRVWLEVLFRSDLQSRDKPRALGANIARGLVQLGARELFETILNRGPIRTGPGVVQIPYASNAGPEVSSRSLSNVFVCGIGPRDVSGIYTATTQSIIENPADIAGHLIARFSGSSAFTGRAVGTEFGSFVRARTQLNALCPGSGTYSGWKLTMPILESNTLRSIMPRIGVQSMALFQSQLSDAGSMQWRAFVDVHDPATSAPERLYRTTGYYFGPDRVVPRTFEARLSDRSSVVTRFALAYGWHDGSGGFSSKAECSPSSTTFALNAAAYKTACQNAETFYGIQRTMEWTAPDVWNHVTAEALLKWIVDSRRARRVLIEFDTYVNAVDLKPGHVIRFHDDIGNLVAYPGLLPGAAWSAHDFNVLNVQIKKDAAQPISVHVVAIETYGRAA